MSSVLPSKRHLLIILVLLLMVYVPYAAALPAGYTARENPANVTATNGQVDYKTLAIMADMYLGIRNISIDLNQSDFNAADIDYQAFRSLYDNNKNVIPRLFNSDADARAALNSTDLTVDDIRTYLKAARDYNETYRSYQNYLASGDRVNATASGIALNTEYRLLSSSYDDLQASTYASMSRLDDSNQESINASLLQPFMDASVNLMSQMAKENRIIQISSSQYNITLSSESKKAQIGDTVVYIARLMNTAGFPVQGANIALYANGVQVASGITGVMGECELSYLVPDSLQRDRVGIDAEYLPPGQTQLPVVSDTLFLSIVDEPSSLSLSLTPVTAAFGDAVTAAGRMTSGRGSPARGQPVDIFINGVHLGVVATGNDGMYTFSFPIAENTPGGDCHVTASYSQVPGDVFSSSSSPAGLLSVIPHQTNISLALSGGNFTVGDMVSMSGKLVSENGLNVSGAKVLAYLDSVDIGDGLTDVNGSYAIQAMIPYGSASGDHSIYAVYAPAGGSLSGSYSDKDAVRVNAIRQVMAINGTPLVLFSNDTLNVTGSLHTDSGAPVVSQFVTVRVSDTISGTVVTDQRGDFSFSRTVNGFDPAGFYDVSVSLPSSMDVEPADAGHVLILPVDKAVAITFFAAILAILFVLVLLANAGMSPDKLIRLATGRLRLEADIDDEVPAEPPSTVSSLTSPVAPAPQPQIPANIGERIRSGSLMEAAVSIYTTARRIAISRGVKVRDSDTHREFYRMAVKSYPFLADHLRHIVDTYERMRYGHLDASAGDLQDSLSGLTAMQAELIRESEK